MERINVNYYHSRELQDLWWRIKFHPPRWELVGFDFHQFIVWFWHKTTLESVTTVWSFNTANTHHDVIIWNFGLKCFILAEPGTNLAKKVADDFLKSSAKFSWKQTIDDWVDCRVAVSQPAVICQLTPRKAESARQSFKVPTTHNLILDVKVTKYIWSDFM